MLLKENDWIEYYDQTLTGYLIYSLYYRETLAESERDRLDRGHSQYSNKLYNSGF